MGSVGLAELVVLLVVFVIGGVGTGVWIWMLVDCLTKEREGNTKLVWALVILLGQVVGAVLYLAIRRPERKRELGA
jgi:hypothetical protein